MPGIEIPDNKFDQLSRNERFLKKLDQAIQSNLANEQFGVEQLAEAMSLSRVQLYRKLHRICQKNISQYIREYRLKKAKEMLEKDVASASEIAYLVGFNSPSYFNKCFHDFYEITPGSISSTNSSEEEDSRKIKPIYSEHTSEKEQSRQLNTPTRHKEKTKSDFFTSAKTLSKSGNFFYSLLFYIIFFTVLLIITVILVWKLIPLRHPPIELSEADRSIAVLPFKNLSPNPDNKHLCNAMMESLLTQLQQIGDLNVKSSRDVEKYREQQIDIHTIGKELEVSYVVDGSIIKIDDNLKITVQLINTESSNQVWSEEYTGEYSNEIFKFQSNIAKKVATSLNVIISPDENEKLQRPTNIDMLAYDYLMKAKDIWMAYWQTYRQDYLQIALNYTNKAIERDPQYIQAIAFKGQIYWRMNNSDSTLYYARKLLNIDPECAMGYKLLVNYYWLQKNVDAIIENLQLAIKYYKPEDLIEHDLSMEFLEGFLGYHYCNWKNDHLMGLKLMNRAFQGTGTDYFRLGHAVANFGDLKNAEEYLKKAFDLEGMVGWVVFDTQSKIYAAQGKHNQAIHYLDSLVDLGVCGGFCLEFICKRNLFAGNIDQANECYIQYLEEKGRLRNRTDSINLAYLYKRMGRIDESIIILNNIRAWIEEEMKVDTVRMDYEYMAKIYATLYDKEYTLNYIKGAVDFGQGSWWTHLFETDPRFEFLWEDHEFKDLMKKNRKKLETVLKAVNRMRENGEINI